MREKISVAQLGILNVNKEALCFEFWPDAFCSYKNEAPQFSEQGVLVY